MVAKKEKQVLIKKPITLEPQEEVFSMLLLLKNHNGVEGKFFVIKPKKILASMLILHLMPL